MYLLYKYNLNIILEEKENISSYILAYEKAFIVATKKFREK